MDVLNRILVAYFLFLSINKTLEETFHIVYTKCATTYVFHWHKKHRLFMFKTYHKEHTPLRNNEQNDLYQAMNIYMTVARKS